MRAPTLFALGFRPMYLLAGAYAAASILVWAAQVAGAIPAGALAALWIAAPSMTLVAIVLSGALRSAAFALFTVAYWPILSRPRLDGLPG